MRYQLLEDPVTEPTRRLCFARDRYALGYSERENPINPYEVPFPWLRFSGYSASRSYYPTVAYVEFSGDNKIWKPAYLPHIVRGACSTCLQGGAHEDVGQNHLCSITNYTVSYVNVEVKRFWQPLFGNQETRRPLDPKPFMEAWERTDIDDILQFLVETNSPQDVTRQRKVCTKCGRNRALDQYYRNKDGLLGRRSRCKMCEGKRIARVA